ncbi:CdaR family transcriptional regulator [Nocardia sp. BMG111209]|uniref:PucR family transcriptional regulator n=1 Tax=Nocardia sp. BMG111209 TaxID=1160137 RepID=UPI00039E86D7|nr:helix-turn-helix domain-containing protein [Nocardia sp. BMG111209]
MATPTAAPRTRDLVRDHRTQRILLRADAEAYRLCWEFVTSDDGSLTGAWAARVDETVRRWEDAGLAFPKARTAVQQALCRVADTLAGSPTSALPQQLRKILDVGPHLLQRVMYTYHPARRAYFASPPAAGRSSALALLGNGFERGDTAAGIYDAVAIQLAPPADHTATHSARTTAMRRLLRELRVFHDTVLPIVADTAGTLLIPVHADESGDLLERSLAVSAGLAAVSFTAVAVRATAAQVPQARQHAHQLLDLVERLDRGPGLYRLGDLAIEYQLTRPGLARELLAAVIDPLDGHPELLDALAHYIDTGAVAAYAAHELGIHPATLTRRLVRIRELTGLEPACLLDRYRLQAALILRREASPDRRERLPHR